MPKLTLIVDFSHDKQTCKCSVSTEVADGISTHEGDFQLQSYVKGDDLWDRIGMETERLISESPFRDFFGR